MNNKELAMYFAMTAKASVLPAMCLVVWSALLRPNGICLERTEAVQTDSILPCLLMFHSIVAGLSLSRVVNEFKLLDDAINKKDRGQYEKLLHDLMPGIERYFLFMLSVLCMAFVMVIHYDDKPNGVLSIGFTGLVIALFWVAITALDNPLRWPYYRDRIPEDWPTNGHAKRSHQR
jgi:hypothetical protein